MDFFEHQDRARKQTKRLVALFVLAVIAVVACTTLAVWGAIAIANPAADAALSATDTNIQRPFDASNIAKNPAVFIGIAIATLTLILGGSLFRIMQLGGGSGSAIAERLGGRPLSHDTTDPDERRLLNVVEEMAIASGTPVPPVYLLENEAGINAFAAGTTIDNAAIGVTRGTVRHLSRAELQGVIGHEFSHILSGDMKINIRLIGVLAGILIIGHIGSLMLRSAYYVSLAGGSRRSKDKGGGAIGIFLLGAILMAIGFVGAFFGSWIKSAVSRQREYLADASAVQFTRDRNGIAGALKKIGGFNRRALLRTPAAGECSHMYFGTGVSAIFATHPPLAKRILSLDPSWDGTFTRIEDTPEPKPEPVKKKTPAHRRRPVRTRRSTLRRRHDRPAHQRPPRLRRHALLLHPALAPNNGRQPLQRPRHHHRHADLTLPARPSTTSSRSSSRTAGTALMRELRAAAPLIGKLDPALRLPLIELTAPSLQRLSQDQREAFVALTDALITADGKTDLFEWCIKRMVTAPLTEERKWSPTHIYSPKGVEHEAEKLLGWLAIAGHAGFNQAHQAYNLGTAHFGIDASLTPKSDFTVEEIDDAMNTLTKTSPKVKKKLIEACAVVVGADKEVTPQEAELFRAIAEALGVPVPPVLPGQKLI